MATNTVLSYPIPPYQNVPIEPQFFKPSRFFITGIARGRTTTITTSVDLDYVLGQLVRVLIPSKYGSRGLNEQLGYVISIPTTNSVEIDINSIGIDPFISSPTFLPFQSKTLPQIVAVGDSGSGAINPNAPWSYGTFIPGSFQNISPL